MYHKYKFITHDTPRGIETIAISSYAGKAVRGKAICHPNDSYDKYTGREIAAARCDLKIANKRKKRALDKLIKAEELKEMVDNYCAQMNEYYNDAKKSAIEAEDFLLELLDDNK